VQRSFLFACGLSQQMISSSDAAHAISTLARPHTLQHIYRLREAFFDFARVFAIVFLRCLFLAIIVASFSSNNKFIIIKMF
jgi:hypothetical protein